jgi:hypothetical protein
MPGDQVLADAARDFMGEDGFAGAGLAFDEERALECDSGVDRDPKILRRDVSIGALETPHPDYLPRVLIASHTPDDIARGTR